MQQNRIVTKDLRKAIFTNLKAQKAGAAVIDPFVQAALSLRMIMVNQFGIWLLATRPMIRRVFTAAPHDQKVFVNVPVTFSIRYANRFDVVRRCAVRAAARSFCAASTRLAVDGIEYFIFARQFSAEWIEALAPS